MKKRTQPDPIDEALRREPEYQELVKLLKGQAPERLNKLGEALQGRCKTAEAGVERDD
ncbi:MAG: hypothetical protein FJY85_04110 [Deltaproteobacteria bacterium]|nr:hypothetical protein [Deltaproteobacteria bacterium]